ncbi:electron transfer flavoprotein subunit alpha/FixB family protein [Cellulomonas aerilata]|uniref:Electron transfer flavoprotein subunit alpha n=1 Tax=Cellulomonas aerilata TaxID=515326 RepID=A0A512DGS7_9CELL|nr:electron transfer flavoprotein subunit alpha/FixB family protein [Cellulomonas aerilata]GEO35681.1 electron transfer flavoprotein subunit alpha [Cellulomonas aerilata]
MTEPVTDPATDVPTGPVVVLLDHHTVDGAPRLRPPVLELLTLARGLAASTGSPVHAVAVEPGLAQAAAEELGRYGVARVHDVVLPGADPHLTPVVAEALTAVVRTDDASAVLLASTFENKEVAARLAVLTGAGVVSDATGVTQEDGVVVVSKTVFAGTWTTRCAITTPLAVVLVKANAVPAETVADPTTPQVEPHEVTVSPSALRATLVRRTERAASGRPELAEAQTVVAGGRGTDGDFSPVEELADVLGGAVGATRVATDEGWIGHESQIGQTGVTISPQLYIGAGISGAVHHRGGMQASGTIVAVNTDPESPIFEIADFGIVGDLFTVLPQAAEEIRRLRG